MTDRQAKTASLKILRKRRNPIVYHDPWRSQSDFLLGYKGDQFIEEVVFVPPPYIPLYVTPFIVPP